MNVLFDNDHILHHFGYDFTHDLVISIFNHCGIDKLLSLKKKNCYVINGNVIYHETLKLMAKGVLDERV